MNTSTPIIQLSRVTRLHLHDIVTERLRNFLTEGVLPPGTKLNERELCDKLGISRTPLREAIKVLAAEGLVSIVPNRGALVYTLTNTEIRELFELISGLEAFSGLLACERITPDEIAQIKALQAQMEACCDQNDLPGYFAINNEIHDLISLAARNNELRQLYITSNRRLQALRFRSNLETVKWRQAVQEHVIMLQAIEARDGERLSAILRGHLLAKRDAVLRMLEKESADETTEVGNDSCA